MGIAPQQWQIGPAMPLGSNPNPMLAFQASVLRDLAHKPSRLGTPETHPRTLAATQEETVLLGAAQKPQSRRNLHASLKPPPPLVPPHPGTKLDSAMLPDTYPQLSPEGSPPQHCQIGPAMALGPKPNPRSGIQASVPRGLAPKPVRLGMSETHANTLPAA